MGSKTRERLVSRFLGMLIELSRRLALHSAQHGGLLNAYAVVLHQGWSLNFSSALEAASQGRGLPALCSWPDLGPPFLKHK